MNDDNAKIRLKLGSVEIEYEGAAAFLQNDIFNLMEKTLAFYAEHKGQIPAEKTLQVEPSAVANTGGLDYSTNTIAAHLGANTGPDLAIASAAHLMLVKGQDKFTRKEINEEMKQATTYYKSSMTSNLTKSLDTLVKAKRLNQVSKDTYALSAGEKKTLESKLAG